MDKSVVVQPYFGSSRYLSHGVVLEQVDVTLIHHPEHDYNLKEFEGGIEAGLAFVNDNLGSYPYTQLRVVEIPWYQEDSYAMAGAIALSEKEGWYADCGVDEMRGYIQYVLARDLIRQWIAAGGFIADVQGADMLWTALPSALALQIVDRRIGSEQVEQLFVKMRKKYHKDRNNEPNREPPLALIISTRPFAPGLRSVQGRWCSTICMQNRTRNAAAKLLCGISGCRFI